jgi:hypothetical protein
MKPNNFFILTIMIAGILGAAAIEITAAPRAINSCQTITEPGSYQLSRNLRVEGDCLIVAADNVTIDLDGFTIEGDGTGQGIGDADIPRQNITVRNGTVRNFRIGVSLAKPGGEHSVRSVIERIRAVENTFFGIRSGRYSVVRDCIASDNGTSGIFVSGGLIVGNVANRNSSTGILALCPSNLVGNIASENGAFNIFTSGEGCTTSNNNPAQ